MSINYYMQAPDGQAVYHIERDRSWKFDGEVREVYRDSKSWAVVVLDAPATTLTKRRQQRNRLDQWNATTEGVALGLTPTLPTAPPEAVEDFYRQAFTVTDEVEEVDVSAWRALDVEPRYTIPSNWSPSTLADVYGPGFAHVVPGWLTGFRAAAVNIAKEYGDCYDNNGNRSPLIVSIRTYWSPPKYTKPTKREPKRQTWNTHRCEVTVPNEIGGQNLADALARWDAEVAALRARIEGERQTYTCGHCNGLGYTEAEPA